MEMLDEGDERVSAGDIGSQEVPVTCYLAASEGRGLAIIALTSITSWTMHRCKRFLSFATCIEVMVPFADYVVAMWRVSVHLRLQALMVVMLLFNPVWVVGTNPWVDATMALASLIQDRESFIGVSAGGACQNHHRNAQQGGGGKPN